LDALRALSNPKTFAILENIALSDVDQQFLCTHLDLSHSEYYSSISFLLKNGIITKKKGKYSLTAFGRIVCDAQNIIARAYADYWKLTAIDSLESRAFLPSKEYCNIVNKLLCHKSIRKALEQGKKSYSFTAQYQLKKTIAPISQNSSGVS
jgi:predicted transcriptional regulator